MKIVRTLFLAVAVAFGVAAAASADTGANAWSPYVGQPGGDAFSFSCGSTPLVLLTVTSKSVVNGTRVLDSLKASCWNGSTSPVYGAPWGSEFHAQCNPNHAAGGVYAYHGWYVNGVRLFCRGLSVSTNHDSSWVGGKTGTYTSLRCASPWHVKRIRGSHGQLIDRLAVYCGSV